MMCCVYIIYSPEIDKFYVGHTCDDIDQRIRRHQSNHKGFTGKAKDWELKHIEFFESKSLAFKREKQIKGWKSRQLIEKLIAGSGHPD